MSSSIATVPSGPAPTGTTQWPTSLQPELPNGVADGRVLSVACPYGNADDEVTGLNGVKKDGWMGAPMDQGDVETWEPAKVYQYPADVVMAE